MKLAERVGFEPTWGLRPQRISSPRRYGHFGTSPNPVQHGGGYSYYRVLNPVSERTKFNSTIGPGSTRLEKLLNQFGTLVLQNTSHNLALMIQCTMTQDIHH